MAKQINKNTRRDTNNTSTSTSSSTSKKQKKTTRGGNGRKHTAATTTTTTTSTTWWFTYALGVGLLACVLTVLLSQGGGERRRKHQERQANFTPYGNHLSVRNTRTRPGAPGAPGAPGEGRPRVRGRGRGKGKGKGMASSASSSSSPFLLRESLREFSAYSARDRGYWGTYRSSLYFGLRAKTTHSLLFGVMWWDPNRPRTFSDMRHNAEQGHGLEQYGWTRHDGETFGIQDLQDGNIHIKTSWIKDLAPPPPTTTSETEETEAEGGLGGDFAIRIRADSVGKEKGQNANAIKSVCVIFYVLDEMLAFKGKVEEGREKPTFSIHASDGQEGINVGAKVVQLASGYREDVKRWAVHMAMDSDTDYGSDETGESGPLKWSYVGDEVSHVHNLTDFAKMQLYYSGRSETLDGRGGFPAFSNKVAASEGTPNVAMFQLMLPLGQNVDLVFNSGLKAREAKHSSKLRSGKKGTYVDIEEKVRKLSGDRLSALLEAKTEEFDKKFDKIFPIKEEGAREVARRALSNLVGSIGYFVGNVLIADVSEGKNAADRVRTYPQRSLFTAVPSRSFFPRGFLWDEGFHQLVIQKWNSGLSREMMASWFDLMNVKGWIPREAILGDEALARVPSEFVVQNPSHANPPSMLISLHKMASSVKNRESSDTMVEEKLFLEEIYPYLKIWFGWFLSTQKGPVEFSYRWRGRDATTDRELNPKTLTSGLDDYPRATHPSNSERHLDLRCWMALGARTMSEIAEIADASKVDILKYEKLASSLEDENNLDDLHYDTDSGMYFDWGEHTDTVTLVKAVNNDGSTVVFRKQGEELPSLRFVKEFGYVSLFPFMMKLIDPKSKKLEHHLKHLKNETLLWTPYGLRSLATNSNYYNKYNTEHDKPYWRSPIWININYLVLDALGYYAQSKSPYSQEAKRLFQELRARVLGNIVDQYQKTGFLWENYDDAKGEGKGSHPFTGWTALFILIASNVY